MNLHGKDIPEKYIRTESDRKAIQEGYYIDYTEGMKSVNFFEHFLIHSSDRFQGKPFKLLPWQRDEVIFPLYAWKHPDGTRRFTNVKIGIPKKNGKSTLMAGLALHELFRGANRGHIALAAYERDQARIIFNEARAMLLQSKKLLKLTKSRENKAEIEHIKRLSKIKAVSKDPRSQEGLNPSIVIFDEIHIQKNRHLWNALRYAMSAREQPLLIWLSTAGEYDPGSLWMEEFDIARKIQNSEMISVNTLAVLYEADPKDDILNPETWRKSNPSLEHTLPFRTFKEDVEDAIKKGGTTLNSFKRYRLNLTTLPVSEWVNSDLYSNLERLETEEIQAKSRENDIVAGLDLSEVHDMTSLVVLFNSEKTYIHPYYFLPEGSLQLANVSENDKSNYDQYLKWANDGWLETIPSKQEHSGMDFRLLAKKVAVILSDWNVTYLACDQWKSRQFLILLQEELEELEHNCKLFFTSPVGKAAKEGTLALKTAIETNKLCISYNPIFDWNFKNVTVKKTYDGVEIVSKQLSKNKIDGVSAAVYANASLIAMLSELNERKKSRYESDESIDW